MILPVCKLESTATHRRHKKHNHTLVCGPLRIPSQSRSQSNFWIDVTDQSVTIYGSQLPTTIWNHRSVIVDLDSSIWIRRSGCRSEFVDLDLSIWICRSGFVDLDLSIWIRRSGFVDLKLRISKVMCGPHPIRFWSSSLQVLHTVVHLSNVAYVLWPIRERDILDRHNILNRSTPNLLISSP